MSDYGSSTVVGSELVEMEGTMPDQKRKEYISTIVFKLALVLVFVHVGPSSILSAAPSKKISVVLISVDTLRADRLSSYGYHGYPTPHIDGIAKGGTLFSAISSQIPLTLPSHTCLLTSTYPFANGIEENGQEVPAHAVTLARVLKSHGYQTAAFVGGFVLDRRFGLNQGFDFYDSPFGLHNGGERHTEDTKRLSGEVVDSAIQWLQRNDRSPFFIFLHLYDLHSPYNVPPPYRARFGTGYEAELRYVDAETGRFWSFLSQNRLLENTLVIFTADHGEGLGQHEELTHGYFIYQSTLWVPLIFHWPTESKISFPLRIDAPAGLVDVGPTILQFLGITPPPQFQGKSFLGWLYSGKPRLDREVYSESLYAHDYFGCSGLQGLRIGRYTYIDAPKPELYDLEKDPGELHNLYSQEPTLALASRERLLAFVKRFKAKRSASRPALSPEVIARLNSLGYVAMSSAHSTPIEAGADPKDLIFLYRQVQRAIEMEARGQTQAAAMQLDGITAQHPELLIVQIEAGLEHQKLGQNELAARHFREALHVDPENALAHYDLGISLGNLHELVQAASEFELAIKLQPWRSRAYTALGSVQAQLGRIPAAIASFDDALAIDPMDFDALLNRGNLYLALREWAKGDLDLRRAVELEPDNTTAHLALGTMEFYKGDLNKALQEYRRALQLNPQSSSVHSDLGLLYVKLGRKAEASAEFRRALAINPDNKVALNGLQNARDTRR
jgi:choline-sulfatase